MSILFKLACFTSNKKSVTLSSLTLFEQRTTDHNRAESDGVAVCVYGECGPEKVCRESGGKEVCRKNNPQRTHHEQDLRMPGDRPYYCFYSLLLLVLIYI